MAEIFVIKLPMGRPPKYDDLIPVAVGMILGGKTLKATSKALGIPLTTLHRKVRAWEALKQKSPAGDSAGPSTTSATEGGATCNTCIIADASPDAEGDPAKSED